MNIQLEDCKLITNIEYCRLNNPEFVGQTKLDENNEFYMVWRHEGVLYKTKNVL